MDEYYDTQGVCPEDCPPSGLAGLLGGNRTILIVLILGVLIYLWISRPEMIRRFIPFGH